jgi:flavin reductase
MSSNKRRKPHEKVLTISSSLRKHSISEQLALQFAKGAKSAEHDVEFVSMRDMCKNI